MHAPVQAYLPGPIDPGAGANSPDDRHLHATFRAIYKLTFLFNETTLFKTRPILAKKYVVL